MKQEYRKTSDTVFNQATKKDAHKVTAGKYTMSTTKKGKLIHQVKPYDVQLKKLWRIGRECGKLTVRYRMGHTLEAMGIQLRPTDWTKIVTRRSSDNRLSSSGSSVELQGSPPASVLALSPGSLQQQPTTTESTSTEISKDVSPPPPPPPPTTLQCMPSLLSISSSPHNILQQPTIFLAQNTAGGGRVIYLPSIIMPVKSEPEDVKPDIKCLQFVSD